MRYALAALLALLLTGCASSFAHKAVDVTGNDTVGAGAQLNRNGLTLNGVTRYSSTTAPIERERARIAEAKAREAEAKLALAKLRAATPLTVD